MKQANINLSHFQTEFESATKNFKGAATKLLNAQQNFTSAESRYIAAKNALNNAVCTVGAQNKIPL
jgi:cytochrome c556